MVAHRLQLIAVVALLAAGCGSPSTAPSVSPPVTPSAPALTPTANPLLSDPRFNLPFYHLFVLGNSAPNAYSLKRWTANISLYIRTTRDDTGAQVDPSFLDLVEGRARAIVPQWSGGQYQVASVTRGTGTGTNTNAVTVFWRAPDGLTCGETDINSNAIVLMMPSAAVNCGCGPNALSATTIDHEFGHTAGYWHTDDPKDVMYPVTTTCNQLLSSREAFHAQVAYTEPVGSFEPH